MDHALEPDLAKELKIRDNGTIALVRGEGEEQQVESIKIGEDFDGARRNLKKLDEKVQESLLKLTRGKKTAYVTVGHGEMYWKGSESKDRSLSNVKKVLGQLQYTVKELGLTQGLAEEVPEDADLVMVMGPTEPFLDVEVAALDAFRARGGRLLVALEPRTAGGTVLDEDGVDLSGLLGPMGLAFHGDHYLAADKSIAVLTYRKGDRLNLGTNKFSTHESVTTLSRNSKSLGVLTPAAGWLEEIAGGTGKTTVTVRSMDESWEDLNGNLDFDADAGEERKARPLAVAVSGPSEGESEYRAVVVADGSWASDVFLAGVQGNAVFLVDAISWLVEDAALAGTTNNEEDVKIQHTREGQGWIFYATSFLIPLGLLGGGLARVRSRRKRGAA